MGKLDSNEEDILLVRQFKDKDTRNFAYTKIVRKYQERLYWQIRRMLHSHEDTDDVLQNTFLKVWDALGKFRGDSKLSTWLYRVAANEALSFIRKNKKTQNHVAIENVYGMSGKGSAEDPDGDEIKEKLEQAVDSLPEKQKMVFNMKYFEEMKYDEISEVLGTSIGSLKASYHHAVKKIEAHIKLSLNY